MDRQEEKTTDVASKTRQSVVWYTTVPFTIHLLRFANSILLARILAPSDFGIIGIITVILYYCDSFSDFGFGKAIIQKQSVNARHYASYFTFNMLVSLAFFFSVQLSSTSIAEFYEIPELDPALKVFSILFLITAISAGAIVKLKRSISFKSLAIIDALKVFLQMGTSLSLAINGFGFWAIVIAMLCSNAFAMLLLLFTAKYIPRISMDFSPLKDLFRFGLWDFVGAQFKMLGDSADKLILGKVLGATALGFYDKATGLARMPNDQISMRLFHVSFSSFSRAQNDRNELEKYFSNIVTLNALILFPVFSGLFWIAEPFTLVLLGDKWHPMISTLQILAISFMFSSLSNPVVAVNQATDHVFAQTVIRGVLTLAMIAGLIFVVEVGIEAAALVILVFHFSLFVLSTVLLNVSLGFCWSKLLLLLWGPFVLTAVMISTLYLLDVCVTIESMTLGLILSIGIGGLCYSTAFLLFPFQSLAFLRKRALSKLKRT